MIEYKSGERLGFIKKAHTRKSVLVQYRQWFLRVVKHSMIRTWILRLIVMLSS